VTAAPPDEATEAQRAARRLVDLAPGDPHQVRRDAADLLASAIEDGDTLAAALASWALGVAARLGGDLTAARRALDEGIDLVAAADAPGVEGQLRCSRAVVLLYLGRLAECDSDLDRAGQLVSTRGEVAYFWYQKAGILGRRGRWDEAAALYEAAIPDLRDEGQLEFLANSLMNLGIRDALRGDCAKARTRMLEAHRIFQSRGLRSAEASTEHNLGFIAARAGDFPGAMDHFQRARALLEAINGSVAYLALDHCEALLSVGLVDEAYDRCVALAHDLERAGDEINAGEAQLLAAAAGLRAGRFEDAEELAEHAAQRFTLQGREGWPEVAELLRLQAVLARTPQPIPDAVDTLRQLASRLSRLDQHLPALQARLSVVELVGRDDALTALAELERLLPSIGAAPAEYRLQAGAAKAVTLYRLGRRAAAEDCALAAFRMLEGHQQILGALDARVHLSAQARGIVEVGLRVSRDDGDNDRFFEWAERSSATALRFPPVLPPDDDTSRDLLDRLRSVTGRLRLDDVESGAALAAEQRALQERLALELRRARGSAPAFDPVPRSTIESRLDDWSMLTFVEIDDRLLGLELPAGTAVEDLGPAEEARAHQDAMDFALRRLQRSALDATQRTTLYEQVERHANWLDERLLGWTTSRAAPVVIVPTLALTALQWAVLPSLAARPFVISPSASLWAALVNRPRRELKTAALIAGADLKQASLEIRRLAAHWAEPIVLDADDAVARRVSKSCEGVDLVHLAAHYEIARGNPLFSSVPLVDGPLYAYELMRIDRPPEVLVFAGCESVRTGPAAGAALLGAAHTLLVAGVRSVIGTAGLVPDDETTTSFLDAVHAGLARGDPAPVALAAARQEFGAGIGDRGASSMFLCFGAA
jgi:tetratricopeptide (TPR) repeat protein